MKKTSKADKDVEAALPAFPITPIEPIPLRRWSVSGLYELRLTNSTTPWPIRRFLREELRLDVDGRYPQMTASGTIYQGLKLRVHWIAELQKSDKNQWAGDIWFKDGTPSPLPHIRVTIVASPSWFPAQQKVTVTFIGPGARTRTVTYSYKSPYFHPVEFEFDTVENATAVTSIGTHDHPNRPATLPNETLSIETVFRRTGFDVARSGDNMVPLGGAGPDERWSDNEMHDAMQVHWSRFADKPQWALWVFFAALHERGTGLGGIMFDDIGPNHRQGTAIFTESFISQAPAGDPNPAAWVARMRFWTAVHEMGHGFNLAHSWQKSHPPAWGTPWIPLTNDSEARSFMNYPFLVAGGQSAFFADFGFRFIDEELLFMRHAPSRFVQMGNADWFDNHGFEQAEVWSEPTFKLEARVNRPKPVFEFLEPVCVELKLTNVSGEVKLLDADILRGDHDITVILKKDGKPARQWKPYAAYCMKGTPRAIDTNESIYEALFVSAGLNGWDLAEPGNYTVQVAIRYGDEDIVSNPLRLQVKPPRGFDEEDLAQDMFSEAVGRVLAFDGTRAPNLGNANDALREIIERLPDRRVATHARVALALPDIHTHKLLTCEKDSPKIKPLNVQADKALDILTPVFTGETDKVAETLSHIDYKFYVDSYSTFLSSQGDKTGAAKAQGALHDTLSARGVLKKVLKEIKDAQKEYQK